MPGVKRARRLRRPPIDCTHVQVRPRPVSNPPNPWRSTEVEWLGERPSAPLRLHLEQARSIVSENRSPDVGFRFSVNPYRGCVHACAYCYARPSHQYLGFGAGSDFDREIVVKANAPALLAEAFARPSWEGELLVFSGNTDCYQPVEASYGLTRACLEVCARHRQPVHVITKSALVRRDVDVLGRLAREAAASVTVSIPFADAAMARAIEPYAPSPAARFETVRRLADVGLRVSVNVAPVIPGLNDPQVSEIVARAADAGASSLALLPVRLPAEVLPVFFERLAEAFPDRVQRVESALVQIRRGRLNDARFGSRMVGSGPRWEAIAGLFSAQLRRLGLGEDGGDVPLRPVPSTFRRPSAQGSLFD